MKKNIYIALFTLLGVLVGFLIHAIIEIPAIFLLVSDFEKWNLGLSWESWIFVHNVWAILLFLIGVTFGYKQGKHWWKVIYIDKNVPWKK